MYKGKEDISREAIDYVYHNSYRFRDREQAKAIAEMRLSGAHYVDISKAFNLSTTRCREIVNRTAQTYRIYLIKSPKTNYGRIKNMSFDEMAEFFGSLANKNIIETADSYICRKCRKDHGGHCPIKDDEHCLYEMDDVSTMKLWLEGKVEDETE